MKGLTAILLAVMSIALLTGCRSAPTPEQQAQCSDVKAKLHDVEHEVAALEFKRSNAFSAKGYLKAPFSGAKSGGLIGGLAGLVLYPVVSGRFTQDDKEALQKAETSQRQLRHRHKSLNCKRSKSSLGSILNAG